MITTHVLDTAKGKPASGVKIRLDVLRGSVWEVVGTGATDSDGRLRTLTEGIPVEVALYRLTFTNQGFFPEIAIMFKVEDPTQHYHVPLLLSPFGYSTYRGS